MGEVVNLAALRDQARAVRGAVDGILIAYGGLGPLIMATGDVPLRLGDTFHWPEEQDGPIDFWRVVSLLDTASGLLHERLRAAELVELDRRLPRPNGEGA